MKKRAFIKRLPFVGVIVILVFLFLGVSEVNGQGQQPKALSSYTTTPTSTPTATPIATATFTLDQQAGDLLNTYKEVLTTSKNTVDEVHTTTNQMLDLIGKLFTALTVVGVIGTGLFTYLGQRASDKANTAQQKATEALDNLQRLDAKTIDLETRNGSALQTTNELTQKQNDLKLQIGAAEKLLHSLQAEIAQVKSSGEQDRQFIKKPLTLVQIDEYIMQAVSGSPAEKDSSILSLIEMSTRSDAVVRRRAAKAFGVLDEYDERVAKRLKEMIESDHAKGVRKEAENSLSLIETKKPKKTTRRKS